MQNINIIDISEYKDNYTDLIYFVIEHYNTLSEYLFKLDKLTMNDFIKFYNIHNKTNIDNNINIKDFLSQLCIRRLNIEKIKTGHGGLSYSN